jgi:L-asparaginase
VRKLLLISTGGTISQEKDEHGTAHPVESKGAEAFSAKLSEIANTFNIEIVPRGILNKDSSNIVPADWDLMINTIVEEYEDYDAFIITHGTNTLGYTCAALAFALGKLGKPVIVTGSQVSYGYPGSDALMNLENAIRVAACERGVLVGVVAVFGSHIITGVRVKKTTEFEYDAFTTFSSKGSLGRIGRKLRWDKPLLERHNQFMEPLARSKAELDVRPTFETDIVSLTEFPGLKSQVLRALVEGGAKGIVYRAAGAGDPNVAGPGANFDNLREGFEYLREKEIPIVITTQAAEGVASMDVNDPGKIAFELGAIPAWDMSLEAMTIKLAWLLGKGFPYREMKTLMLHSHRGEIDPARS